MLDLGYSNLLHLIQPYRSDGRTESTAFLHWFLVNLYRLDLMEVEDIVCDGRGDKGIDGIYVNDNEDCIDIFQSKIVQNSAKTLGDTQLKEFVGSLIQLKTEGGVDSLIASTDNSQLKNLLIQNKKAIVSQDYSIRGIFITNANKDYNADNYLKTFSSVLLEVWDRNLIAKMYVPSEKAIQATSELSFDVFGINYLEYNFKNIAKVVIVPLSATDLVKMDGINNQQLFDLNLRKGLGKTKVNKDILKSIESQTEHGQFLLYHNGITIICSKIDTLEEGKIKIKDYSVVNGCQSVSCLYEKRSKVTQDLRILSRIIEVKPGSEDLISKITYNSNNQNGIKARDFRSNTQIQVRLQREIHDKYPPYAYQIKTGDRFDNDRIVIENGVAGQLLLAFDLREPTSVQRPGKIFDEFHQKIFARPEVNGGRIVVLYKIYEEIQKDLGKIEPELFAKYQITKFFLLYLLAEVFERDELGRDFLKNPEKFFQGSNQECFISILHIIIGELIIDTNDEFKERGGEDFDFKAIFKSPNELQKLKNDIISAYQKLINRGRVDSFSQLWRKQQKET